MGAAKERQPITQVLLVPDLARHKLELMHGQNPYLSHITDYPPLFEDPYTLETNQSPSSFKTMVGKYFRNWKTFSKERTPIEFTLHLVDLATIVNEHIWSYEEAVTSITRAANRTSIAAGVDFHAVLGFCSAYLMHVSVANNPFERPNIDRFVNTYLNAVTTLPDASESFVRGYTRATQLAQSTDLSRMDFAKVAHMCEP